MAIKIPKLEKISNTYTEKQYLYKDLALDIAKTRLLAPGVNLPIPSVDVKASFDLAAIRNSLQNLFNTLPGQRFLFPDYGLDLYQYLFQPINELNGQIIGTTIFTTISKYEPRITVIRVDVKGYPDISQYIINIIVRIPGLNLNTNIETVFDLKKQSFIVVPTSRNI